MVYQDESHNQQGTYGVLSIYHPLHQQNLNSSYDSLCTLDYHLDNEPESVSYH